MQETTTTTTTAVNLWSAFGFGMGSTLWGAFPGNSDRDIQSGKGFVHNTFMLDHPQKNVLRAPFKMPFDIKLVHFPNFKNSETAMDSLLNFEGTAPSFHTSRTPLQDSHNALLFVTDSGSFFSIIPVFKNMFSG